LNRLTTVVAGIALCFAAGSAGAQTLFNDPSRHVYDTTDPLCSGNDPSIVFCDGFEDGVWVSKEARPSDPSEDGWNAYTFALSGRAPYPDPSGRGYAECKSRDGLSAPHGGAAGTDCAASAGWNAGWQSGIHADMRTAPGKKLRHMYLRFYVKFKGSTSQICGSSSCPDFRLAGPNGIKLLDWLVTPGSGGIVWGDTGTPFASDDVFIFGANCQEPSTVFVRQNQGTVFNRAQHNDRWIYFEIHAEMNSSPGARDGVLEYYIDDCGPDGNSCPATPTLRLRRTDFAWTPTGGCFGASWPQNGFDVIHFNGWSSGSTGEMQWDEIVIRDGDVANGLIGFRGAGSSPPPPPPPTNTPPEPPVLLPVN
jgi:hypothetical protein